MSIWLGYLCFVVYGSLVPLQFKPRLLSDALTAFQGIAYLNLGIYSRADWIANGVLYVPVGFLTVFVFKHRWPQFGPVFRCTFAVLICALLAVSVEFAQLFFPPRTVSLNDLIAELLGGLLGVVLVVGLGNWFRLFLQSFLHGEGRVVLRGLQAYAMAYFVFALFPFDFLLSAAELSDKLQTNRWGWLLAGSDQKLSIQVVKLVAEVALTAPFGLLLARLASAQRVNLVVAAVTGLFLGGFIEITQLFTASGISQGLSVLSRVVGVAIGVALGRWIETRPNDFKSARVQQLLVQSIPAFAIPYCLILLEVNGWITRSWQGISEARTRLADLHFLPFYYHYFTSEAAALFSVAAVTISYTPLGVMVWAISRKARLAAFLALVVAGAIEAGKLFIKGARPDPTNILIAALTAWATVNFLLLAASEGAPKPHDLPEVKEAPATLNATVRNVQPPFKSPSATAWIGLASCLAIATVWWLEFPALQLLTAVVLLASSALIWHRPIFVFAVIPAALPVFDLAPWSGRFFVDEFDALLLVGLAIAFFRAPSVLGGRTRVSSLSRVVAAIVILSFAISAGVGLMPLNLPDDNAFNNYFSHFNSLRILKGGIWALIVYGLSQRFASVGIDARRPLAWGLAIGLALTVAYIAWERIAFSGLWNYASGYRVTGPFSAIHVGGAYIECFLAAATSFLLILIIENRQWTVRIAGLLVLLGTTYALMVTFSRNGYPAFAVSVAVVLAFAVTRSKRMIRSGLIAAGVVAALLVVAVPIFKGEFAQARIETIRKDLAVRYAHWNDALSIRDASLSSSLFGMGLGTYPELNYWRSTEYRQTGTYRLETQAGNRFLRLGSGDSIYMEQLVSVKPGQQYVLKLRARANSPDAKITVPICEKWLLTSYNCVWQTVELGKKVGEWQSIERQFTAKDFTVSPWYSQRPVKLALYNPGPKSIVDVDDVHLETKQGKDLVRNGGFSQQLDHWFVVTDSHLQWHTKSMFYGLLFDQGWLGLLAVGAMLTMALANGVKNALKGDAYSAAAVAALGSFLIVAVFDTLIDSPRFLLLLFLISWACYTPRLQGSSSELERRAKRSMRHSS